MLTSTGNDHEREVTMQFMKAIMMAAILSGTTLVTTDALSQATATSESTTTPVARLKVGSVVAGAIQSATLIDKNDKGFSFRIASQNGRPPIIVVVNGVAPSQEFSIEDGWNAINAALKAAGFGG